MRAVNSFIIVVVVALLFMLPFGQAVYDFRTDVREDEFDITTAAGVTTANATLVKPIYDDDYQTISILSDLSTDNATFVSYNATTRVVNIAQLTASQTRTLTISYDINALSDNTALDLFLDQLPWIYILFIVVILGMSIYAIWRR